MTRYFGLVMLASLASAATAQTGTYTWQGSSDNGATWSSGFSGGAGATVKIRLLASWTGVTGTGVGFAGGQFDAMIVGGTVSDVVSNIVRPAPFAFASQTLVASVPPNGIMKIDTAADLANAGAGSGWVNPGQAPLDLAAPGTFNSINGAVVFQFSVLCSGLQQLEIDSICNATAGRAMSIYSNSAGTQIRIDASNVTVIRARDVSPTPGSLSLLALGGLATARRRR